MVQNYTPVMWDDKAFAFVPYEAFGDLPHYPKEKCEQICKELNSLIRLCTYRPKKEDIYFHPVSYVCRSGGFIVTDNPLRNAPILLAQTVIAAKKYVI